MEGGNCLTHLRWDGADSQELEGDATEQDCQRGEGARDSEKGAQEGAEEDPPSWTRDCLDSDCVCI